MADYLDREHEELHYGYIRNFTVDHCIILSELPNGRGLLSIDPKPIDATNDSKELRAFMLKTALSWLDQLETIPFKSVVNDNESNT